MGERIIKPAGEYLFIKPVEFLPALKEPLWYLDSRIAVLLQEYTQKDGATESADWRQTQMEVIRMFAHALDTDTIALGNAAEGFNDDDRWIPEYYGKNPKVERNHPDTVVIHHTQTSPTISLSELDAWGLLRLYVPEYIAGFPSYDGTKHPISSGHFRDGRQTFIGYHHLVRPDGSTTQVLKDEYTGFHAGDYNTNCRSIGITLVEDLSEKVPTNEALNTVARLTKGYQPARVLGHREVTLSRTGKPVDTICPGNRFLGTNGWKQELLRRVGS